MGDKFFCKNQYRQDEIKNPEEGLNNNLNGIDYLEVAEDQKSLEVHFLHNLPGQPDPVPNPPAPALSKENIRITGGVRVKNITVQPVFADKDVLTVPVNTPGDFSTYTLMVIHSSTNLNPPDGFDLQLSSVEFSFKAGCSSDFDCRQERFCPAEQRNEPKIDYLVKDYASFRRLMLDRLSAIMPGWTEHNPADMQIALLELLAYTGDQLSYFQDAICISAGLCSVQPGMMALSRSSISRLKLA